MHPSSLHEASELTVSGGPIRSVTVVVDPGMVGRIALNLKADDEAEVSAVSTKTKASRLVIDVPPREVQVAPRRGIIDRIFRRTRVVHGDLVGGRQQDDGDRRPTLDLTLRVPAACPVRLSLSGLTHASVGDGVGDLGMDLAGSVHATVGSVQSARVDATGNVLASLASTNGDLTVEISGSSRVEVDVATAGNLSLQSSGSGVLKVRGGEFGKADVKLCGAGVLAVEAVVRGELVFEGTGTFKAEFACVQGKSKTRKTGSGTVRIAGRNQPAG